MATTDDTSGIRQKGYNEPNYPAGEPRGSEVLAFTTDLLSDPSDPNGNADPTHGWKRGIGIASQPG